MVTKLDRDDFRILFSRYASVFPFHKSVVQGQLDISDATYYRWINGDSAPVSGVKRERIIREMEKFFNRKFR